MMGQITIRTSSICCAPCQPYSENAFSSENGENLGRLDVFGKTSIKPKATPLAPLSSLLRKNTVEDTPCRRCYSVVGLSIPGVVIGYDITLKWMGARMDETKANQAGHQQITACTAEIVGAYVGCHTVAVNDLPALIATVGQQLAGLRQEPIAPEEEKPKPAVPIKRSVREDGIICLICGKAQKILKRHLTTRHELTPDAYRSMFGLNDDYPLVAPAYAATRSAIAKKIGLGRNPEPAKPAKAPRKRTAKKTVPKKG